MGVGSKVELSREQRATDALEKRRAAARERSKATLVNVENELISITVRDFNPTASFLGSSAAAPSEAGTEGDKVAGAADKARERRRERAERRKEASARAADVGRDEEDEEQALLVSKYEALIEAERAGRTVGEVKARRLPAENTLLYLALGSTLADLAAVGWFLYCGFVWFADDKQLDPLAWQLTFGAAAVSLLFKLLMLWLRLQKYLKLWVLFVSIQMCGHTYGAVRAFLNIYGGSFPCFDKELEDDGICYNGRLLVAFSVSLFYLGISLFQMVVWRRMLLRVLKAKRQLPVEEPSFDALLESSRERTLPSSLAASASEDAEAHERRLLLLEAPKATFPGLEVRRLTGRVPAPPRRRYIPAAAPMPPALLPAPGAAAGGGASDDEGVVRETAQLQRQRIVAAREPVAGAGGGDSDVYVIYAKCDAAVVESLVERLASSQRLHTFCVPPGTLPAAARKAHSNRKVTGAPTKAAPAKALTITSEEQSRSERRDATAAAQRLAHVRGAQLVVLVMSPRALATPHVRRELQSALAAEVPIVPLALEAYSAIADALDEDLVVQIKALQWTYVVEFAAHVREAAAHAKRVAAGETSAADGRSRHDMGAAALTELGRVARELRGAVAPPQEASVAIALAAHPTGDRSEPFGARATAGPFSLAERRLLADAAGGAYVVWAAADATFAAELARALAKRRVNPHLNFMQGAPGEVWRQSVARAVERASLVLFVATEASVASRYCREEVQAAIEADKVLLAAMPGAAPAVDDEVVWDTDKESELSKVVRSPVAVSFDGWERNAHNFSDRLEELVDVVLEFA